MDVDEDEGLRLLLGGVSVFDLAEVDWSDVEEENSQEKVATKGTLSPATTVERGTNSRQRRGPDLSFLLGNAQSVTTNGAYHMTKDGRMVAPPVCVVDMGEKGNGLIAARKIRKGEVIFTEKVALGTQLPSNKDVSSTTSLASDDNVFAVRGCQGCLRSLEPVTSCCNDSSDGDLRLPLEKLWPIRSSHSVSTTSEHPTTELYRCPSCNAVSCSLRCHDKFNAVPGKCCLVKRVVQAAFDKSQPSDDQAAIVLGALLYTEALLNHRYKGVVSLGDMEGLCGEPQDVVNLELGESLRDPVSGDVTFSLEPVFHRACGVLAMSTKEQQDLSYAYFGRCVAVAARNGISLTTQSPFKAYYAALTRESGGRGTPKHAALMRQVALALGSKEGVLRRGMDKEVEARCAATAAVLCPLVARMNHSCDPCAEIRNQEYVDAYVDVAARRDIDKGEEITISYVHQGANSRRDKTRRRRELRAKYLFDCTCESCSGK